MIFLAKAFQIQELNGSSLFSVQATKKSNLNYISYILWYVYLYLNKYIHISLYTRKISG